MYLLWHRTNRRWNHNARIDKWYSLHNKKLQFAIHIHVIESVWIFIQYGSLVLVVWTTRRAPPRAVRRSVEWYADTSSDTLALASYNIEACHLRVFSSYKLARHHTLAAAHVVVNRPSHVVLVYRTTRSSLRVDASTSRVYWRIRDRFDLLVSVRCIKGFCLLMGTSRHLLYAVNYTQGGSDVISIHIHASWFSPPSCR